MARLVLPTPPTPVSVTILDLRKSSATSERAVSRPRRLVARAGDAVSAHAVLLAAILIAGVVLALYGKPITRWLARQASIRRLQSGTAAASDATMLYERMLDLLEKRGIRKPPWVTPLEFVHMLPASETSALVDRLTHAYNQCRFGGRREAASHMLELLERIERS